MPVRLLIAIGGLIASFLVAGGAYWKGKEHGETKCRLEQSNAALRLEKEIRGNNDKIDAITPRDADADAQWNWLLEIAKRKHKAD